MGWAFHWPAYNDPFFITPQGEVIRMVVDQDIPFFEEQTLRCQPVRPNATFVILGSDTTQQDVQRTACPIEEAIPEGDESESPPTEQAVAGGGTEANELPLMEPVQEPESDTSGSDDEDKDHGAADSFMMDNEKAEDCAGLIGTYKPDGDEEEVKKLRRLAKQMK